MLFKKRKEVKEAILSSFLAEKEAFLKQIEENPSFFSSIEEAVYILADTPNRIITTGMGKSGLVAQKVAATFTSTGSPSVFLHPADALHGDIGNIQPKEVVLAFSNSGDTREIIELIPHIKLLGGKIVGVTGRKDSFLAKEADHVICYHISHEGCPLDLAPMASTTLSLAIGDAIAAGLIVYKGFTRKDFSRYHPAGSLGRKLLAHVEDFMIVDKRAFLSRETPFREIISSMVSTNLGAVLVLGSKGHLRGIITDGDIKRLLEKYKEEVHILWSKRAKEIMNPEPVYVFVGTLVEEALSIMQERGTYVLPVVNKRKKPVGILRMHDILPGGHSER